MIPRSVYWPLRHMSHSPTAQLGQGTGSGRRTMPTTRSPFLSAARSGPGPPRGPGTRARARGASCPGGPSRTCPPRSRRPSRRRRRRRLPRGPSPRARRAPGCPPGVRSLGCGFDGDGFHCAASTICFRLPAPWEQPARPPLRSSLRRVGSFHAHPDRVQAQACRDEERLSVFPPKQTFPDQRSSGTGMCSTCRPCSSSTRTPSPVR